MPDGTRPMRRVVITGGAGFLGSHLCEHFVGRGLEVVAVDNLLTGSMDNLAALIGNPGFSFQEAGRHRVPGRRGPG
jgi:dTDP-glucose 4,6-dehydratase